MRREGKSVASREEIVTAYLEAQKSQNAEKIKQVGEALAAAAVLASPRGNVEGRDAILERLKNPGQAAMLFSRVSWKAPEAVDGGLKVTADIPAGSPIPIREFSQVFKFGADDQLSRIEVVFQR
jgi:hypothetical protein